jgi:Spherulation-specific family 4
MRAVKRRLYAFAIFGSLVLTGCPPDRQQIAFLPSTQSSSIAPSATFALSSPVSSSPSTVVGTCAATINTIMVQAGSCPSGSPAVSQSSAQPAASAPAQAAGSCSPPTANGILVPLYAYPSTSAVWAPVISAKQANPAQNIVGIINPNSGPGTALDPVYLAAVQQAQAAGIYTIGYIITGYASASLSSMEQQVSDYNQWYHPCGIFVDNMSYTTGEESYYSTLTKYIKALGMQLVVGNPGADTVPSYIGTVDTIQIYENLGMPSPSFLGGWHSSYPKSNFAITAYGVPSLDLAAEQSAAANVQYEYITTRLEPNPYDLFPSYFSTEVNSI